MLTPNTRRNAGLADKNVLNSSRFTPRMQPGSAIPYEVWARRNGPALAASEPCRLANATDGPLFRKSLAGRPFDRAGSLS